MINRNKISKQINDVKQSIYILPSSTLKFPNLLMQYFTYLNDKWLGDQGKILYNEKTYINELSPFCIIW